MENIPARLRAIRSARASPEGHGIQTPIAPIACAAQYISNENSTKQGSLARLYGRFDAQDDLSPSIGPF